MPVNVKALKDSISESTDYVLVQYEYYSVVQVLKTNKEIVLITRRASSY